MTEWHIAGRATSRNYKSAASESAERLAPEVWEPSKSGRDVITLGATPERLGIQRENKGSALERIGGGAADGGCDYSSSSRSLAEEWLQCQGLV